MNRRLINQGGSTTSFLLIGVALVILVAGGLYVLRGRDNEAKVQPTPSVVKNSTTPSSATKKTSKAVPATRPSQSPEKRNTTGEPNIVRHGNPSVPLPATGPSEGLSVAAVLSVLTGVSVSYLQSRKIRSELLRR